MKKRGQISVSFFYIAAVIVLGTIFLFGLIAFGTLDKAKNEAELVSFESRISNDLERIASNYGDVSFKNYRFPSNIGEVVFVDTSVNQIGSVSAWLDSNYPIIGNKINDGIEDDVYLFDDKGDFLKSMDIGELTIAGPGWIAYKNERGRFEVKLTGKGDEAQIGGDFVRIADFDEGIVHIEVEEVPGLILHLKQQDEPFLDIKVKLRVTKESGDGLTDNIFIETLNFDGSDYEDSMNFVDSYIEIPVPRCGDAGKWVDLDPICDGEDAEIAKYVISSISP